MSVKQDKYVNHNELSEILQGLAKEYQDYVDLDIIGRSLENREIWAVTITNKATGMHEKKPAMLVSACIHAGEITGTQVSLYLINYILEHIGKDAYINRILEKRTLYVLPRTNPDGAERFITTEFESWGNLRPFLLDPETQGLERCDVDQNGLLLLMRKKDQNGEWKISKKDNRLMIPRAAYEYGEEYYSIYPEGKLVGDQVNPDDFRVLPRKFQLNMNRNYPDGWNIQTSVQEGGEYPLSEPETDAVAHFIMGHRNIGTLNDLHTNAGVLIRPYSYQNDSHISNLDMEIYKQFGEMGKTETGYDLVGVFEAFATPNAPARRGCLDDWTYENYGILSLTTELWDLAAKAGVDKEVGNYYPDQFKTEEEELAMLKWNDEKLDGKNFVPWKHFTHSQLGKVEIGGWNWKYTAKNPPIQYLEEECEKVSRMLIKQINFLPELEIKSVKTEKLSADIYRVEVIIENAGFMPTYLMEKALQNQVAEEVVCELEMNSQIELINGRAHQNVGHLDGRIRMDRAFYFGDPTADIPKKTATASWILRVAAPCRTAIKIISHTGGSFEAEVILD